MPPKLPVIATVRAAYAGLGQNIDMFVRMVWLPAIALVALTVTFSKLGTDLDSPRLDSAAAATLVFWVDPRTSPFAVVWSLLLALPLYGAVAVAWHRFVLRGRRPSTVFGAELNWQSLRYAGWNTLLTVLGTIAIAIPVMALMELTYFILAGLNAGSPASDPAARDDYVFSAMQPFAVMALLAVAYLGPLLLARRMLLLPGVAVGDNATARRAVITAASGNGLRLIAGLMLCSLPLTIVSDAAAWLLPEYYSDLGPDVVLAISTLAGVVNTGLGTGFLSSAYRYFASQPGGTGRRA